MQEIAFRSKSLLESPTSSYGFRNRGDLPKLNLALSLSLLESLKNRITGALAFGYAVVKSDFVTLLVPLHEIGKIRTTIRPCCADQFSASDLRVGLSQLRPGCSLLEASL